MKFLQGKKEIAKYINVKRTTVVRIDLADCDEYGLRSQKIVIDNGTFRDGTPYRIRAEIRAFCDQLKFVFQSECVVLRNSFGYNDLERMIEYANAPVVKPDSDVVLVVVNSRTKQAYSPMLMHTSSIVYPHCITPLSFVDEQDAFNVLMFMSSLDDEELKNRLLDNVHIYNSRNSK